jgi:hypothetical protein
MIFAASDRARAFDDLAEQIGVHVSPVPDLDHELVRTAS